MVLMLQFRRLQCNEEQCIKRKQMLINCMILRCENDERCSQEVISACMYKEWKSSILGNIVPGTRLADAYSLIYISF